MKKEEIIEDKIICKAFGKTKPQTKKKKTEKVAINAEELLESQTHRVEKAINRVESESKGRVGKI